MAIPFIGTYTQDFDGLDRTGTDIPWTNHSTIPGWYLFRQPAPGTALTVYSADNGSSVTGSFYSYGATGNSDRALGGLGSGGTYFGSPDPGAVAGWIAFAAVNATGHTINSVTVRFNGEQWRNGGNTASQTMVLEYGFGSDFTNVSTWTAAGSSFNWTSPVTGTTAGAVDGNTTGRVNNVGGTLSGLNWAPGTTLWFRWIERNDPGPDHGLAIDDFSLTAAGGVIVTESDGSTNVTEGGATDSYTIVLKTAPTANVTITINPGLQLTVSPTTLTFTPTNWNVPQTVRVAAVDDTVVEGVHTDTITHTATSADPNYNGIPIASVTVNITDNDVAITKIHTIQGNATNQLPGGVHNDRSPLDRQTVTIEGIVIGDFQLAATSPNNVRQLRGFFIQEETADEDGDPTTSEGIFVFTGDDFSTNNLDVQEGQKVRVTGVVSEFFGMTQIIATTVGSVTVIDPGNNLNQITPATINLPVVGDINDYYEQFEGMKVTFPGKLVVSEYFELARFGQIVLTANERPFQYTHIDDTPTQAEYNAFLDALARRRIILDDDDNNQNAPLIDGVGKVFYPQPGGFSTGTQGVNFFRGGDSITGLTGILHWSFAGAPGTDAWRIRPTAANPAVFTVENPRPTTPPSVGGNIRVASFNILNYFTTIDTVGGSNQPRGADSAAEFARQTAKLVQALKGLNADVFGLMELENNGDSPTGGAIKALVDALNAEVGANTYNYINTGKVGTDAITVGLIYKQGVVAPKGSFAVLDTPAFTDPNNTGRQRNRPAIAQTFEVIDPNNPDFGETFNVVVNHFKSKGASGLTAGDPGNPDSDQGDGQSFWNSTRTKAAQALVAWLATDPTSQGDADWLIIGDLNAYKGEAPITALKNAGYTDLVALFRGPNAYSYVFNGQLGYLDYALANSALLPQVTGAAEWHINADEVPLFDYNDTIHDIPGEQFFERKPAGNNLYEPNAFRTSDHDPILVGLDLESPIISFTATTNAVEGSQNGIFTLTRTGSNTNILIFNYSISGTAINGIDYTTLTGTAQFDAGQSSTTITVAVIDDAIAESNETVTLTLIDGPNYNLGSTSTATITIQDNDTAGVTLTESSGSTNVTEGGATDSYTVVLTSQPTANVTITINPGSQLTVSPRTLTFTPANWNVPQTVTVTAVDDALAEGTHTGTIQHTVSSADSNYNGLAISPVTVTITDNDTVGLTILPLTQTVAEGETAIFTVNLSSVSTTVVTVNFATANGTALAPWDFTATSGTLAFAPGEIQKEIRVVTTLDAFDSLRERLDTSVLNHASAKRATVLVVEPTETFTVNLSNASNATILTGTATVAILDRSEGTPANDLLVGLIDAPNRLRGLAGDDIVVGGQQDDSLDGGTGDDVLLGGAGRDTLLGGAGQDIVLGEAGNDFILGEAGVDILYGGEGNDSLLGGADRDIVVGEAGDDTLLGGDGNDYLDGGAGDDVLIGGLGSDGLVGGAGRDRFGFATGAPFTAATIGNDILADFNPLEDFIVLSKTTFTAFTTSSGSVFEGGTPIAAADFAVIATGGATAAGASSALIVYETSTGALFYNPDRATAGLGTGGQFATVSAAPTIPASRILIVD